MSTDLPNEPIRDVAHLGHVELLTPDLDASRQFFVETFGLDEVATVGDSIYLRAWGDFDRTTLKLTQASTAGVGHVGWRTVSPQALRRRVAALEAAGNEGTWIEGDIGHGAAYRFRDPDGHLMEIYYEAERYEAPADARAALPNQPQAYPARGAAPRRIDHLNLLCENVPGTSGFLEQLLGFRVREEIVVDDRQVAAWMSVTPQPHDIALTRDRSGRRGRLHHVTYWMDTREDVLRAADILSDRGVFIEAGPAKHARTQGFFLYMYEPGGNRVELFSGGFMIYAPDWQTVTWSEEDASRTTAWGGAVPESFHTYGTPR
jgi:catechol 2,3-dioxygenase